MVASVSGNLFCKTNETFFPVIIAATVGRKEDAVLHGTGINGTEQQHGPGLRKRREKKRQAHLKAISIRLFSVMFIFTLKLFSIFGLAGSLGLSIMCSLVRGRGERGKRQGKGGCIRYSLICLELSRYQPAL